MNPLKLSLENHFKRLVKFVKYNGHQYGGHKLGKEHREEFIGYAIIQIKKNPTRGQVYKTLYIDFLREAKISNRNKSANPQRIEGDFKHLSVVHTSREFRPPGGNDKHEIEVVDAKALDDTRRSDELGAKTREDVRLPRKRILRACFILGSKWGFTHREIAHIFGISESRVSQYYSEMTFINKQVFERVEEFAKEIKGFDFGEMDFEEMEI